MLVRDPVCGMGIQPSQKTPYRTIDQQTIYFCSEACADLLDANPGEFLSKNQPFFPQTSMVLQNATGPVQVDFVIRGLYSTDNSLLKQTFERFPGVIRACVDGRIGRAAVIYDPTDMQVTHLIEAAQAAGFFIERHTLFLNITGQYCDQCPAYIERVLLDTAGVISASLSQATQEATVAYSPHIGSLAVIRRAIEEAGPYQVYRVAEARQPGEDREAHAVKDHVTLMRKWWF